METINLQQTSAEPMHVRVEEATSILRADHKVVSGLFREYRRAKGADEKRRLIGLICRELTIHAQVEEEIFYPAVREAIPDHENIAEATIEHAVMKELISQVETADPGNEAFEAHVKVLSEYVRHHVDEEQTEIFPRARASGLDMKELGAQIAERKAQLMQDQQ